MFTWTALRSGGGAACRRRVRRCCLDQRRRGSKPKRESYFCVCVERERERKGGAARGGSQARLRRGLLGRPPLRAGVGHGVPGGRRVRVPPAGVVGSVLARGPPRQAAEAPPQAEASRGSERRKTTQEGQSRRAPASQHGWIQAAMGFLHRAPEAAPLHTQSQEVPEMRPFVERDMCAS